MVHYVTLRLRNLDEKAMQRTVSFAWLFYKEVCSMAGWEDELAELLRELGVTQEEPKTHLRPTQISEADHAPGKPSLRPKDEVKRQVQSAEARFWGRVDEDKAENDAWMSDLRLMRREVE